MASTTIIKCTESFNFVAPNGAPVSINKGETFHKEAKRLQGISSEALEKNFKPFVPNHDVETATAAPGEKRSTRIRKPETTESEALAEEPAPERTEESRDTTDYSKLKQPELKALLDERGIDYPSGVVSNANLIALLESKPETTE